MWSMVVNPRDLRFTQVSLGATFKATPPTCRGAGDRIEEAVRKIRNHQLSADDFPRVKVVDYCGVLWSLDIGIGSWIRLHRNMVRQPPQQRVASLSPTLSEQLKFFEYSDDGFGEEEVELSHERDDEGDESDEMGEEEDKEHPPSGGSPMAEMEEGDEGRVQPNARDEVLAAGEPEPRRSGRVRTTPEIFDPSIYWTTANSKKTTRRKNMGSVKTTTGKPRTKIPEIVRGKNRTGRKRTTPDTFNPSIYWTTRKRKSSGRFDNVY